MLESKWKIKTTSIQRLQEHYKPEYWEGTNKTLCVRFRKHQEDAEDYANALFLLVKASLTMSEKDQEGSVMEKCRKRHQDKDKLKFLNLVNLTNMSGWWESVLAISHL